MDGFCDWVDVWGIVVWNKFPRSRPCRMVRIRYIGSWGLTRIGISYPSVFEILSTCGRCHQTETRMCLRTASGVLRRSASILGEAKDIDRPFLFYRDVLGNAIRLAQVRLQDATRRRLCAHRHTVYAASLFPKAHHEEHRAECDVGRRYTSAASWRRWVV